MLTAGPNHSGGTIWDEVEALEMWVDDGGEGRYEVDTPRPSGSHSDMEGRLGEDVKDAWEEVGVRWIRFPPLALSCSSSS